MDESFYRALLHSKAMSGWEIKWARNITVTLVAGALTTATGVGSTPVKTFVVAWAFAAALFILWESAAYFRRRFYAAPFAVYQEQQQEIAVETAKLDGLRKMLEASQADNLSLQEQLKTRRKHQELADFLTERHGYGIRELLNKPPRIPADREGIDAWRAKEAEFTRSVLEGMRRYGCTTQDIHGVEYIGVFATLALHPVSKVAKDLSMLTERLDRIAAVSTKYAND
jgi:hypothetical protein